MAFAAAVNSPEKLDGIVGQMFWPPEKDQDESAEAPEHDPESSWEQAMARRRERRGQRGSAAASD